ncbi:FkbM family methyltransferase [Candidatus Collierbacteria bacterium]|nr:FkbM family methyltransferase [Candidatus Collierbacteria bacterium]
MNYLKKKYTSEYFLHRVEGIADFLSGQIRADDKAILEKVNFSGKTVLDLGFGRGEAMKYAFEHGAKKLVGVDFSKPALGIAKRFLKTHRVPARLHCSDLIKFLESNNGRKKFDLVILLGVIEHVPRRDVVTVLPWLLKSLTPKAIVIINTPVFPVDNDGYQDGIDKRDYEDTDDYEETTGMHINRYTKESLLQFMKENGFTPISTHYFVASHPLATIFFGYPFRFPQVLAPEQSEYAYSRRFGHEPNVTLAKKIFRFFKWKTKAVLIRVKIIESDTAKIHTGVVTVLGGPLAGHRLFASPKKSLIWQDMVLGIYDNFIYDWLEKHFDLTNKVVWDVGAHVGYHSLGFAALVGEKGRVIAFEPNRFNLKRFAKNLSLNHDLTKRIKIIKTALSDKNGTVEFIVSDKVEDTRSSGSHLGNITPPEKLSVYEGFEKTKVKTYRADTLVARKIVPPPNVIKIDVEGAEELVIKGGQKIISKFKPILFIEVHGILQMYALWKILTKLKYKLELLDDAGGSSNRCFVVATAAKLVQ